MTKINWEFDARVPKYGIELGSFESEAELLEYFADETANTPVLKSFIEKLAGRDSDYNETLPLYCTISQYNHHFDESVGMYIEDDPIEYPDTYSVLINAWCYKEDE